MYPCRKVEQSGIDGCADAKIYLTRGRMGRFFSLRTLRPLRLKKGFNRKGCKGGSKGRKLQFHTVFSIIKVIMHKTLFLPDKKIVGHLEKGVRKPRNPRQPLLEEYRLKLAVQVGYVIR